MLQLLLVLSYFTRHSQQMDLQCQQSMIKTMVDKVANDRGHSCWLPKQQQQCFGQREGLIRKKWIVIHAFKKKKILMLKIYYKVCNLFPTWISINMMLDLLLLLSPWMANHWIISNTILMKYSSCEKNKYDIKTLNEINNLEIWWTPPLVQFPIKGDTYASGLCNAPPKWVSELMSE